LKQVKSLGRDTSKTRTAAETVSAKFWAGPPWISWNQIAEQSALAHHTDLVHTARLFALLNLSFADTVIAFYDAKYHYDVWRPITAIRDAAKGADPTWNPLLPTPADPAYPGAHSALSWAAYVVLASFYGDHNRIKLTSSTLPGVVLRFKSYSAAATDTGLSRIYGGVHYRFDHEAGLHLGDKIARFVLHQARSSAFGMRRT
jgi:membrane-associated phospholipid phosphatase